MCQMPKMACARLKQTPAKSSIHCGCGRGLQPNWQSVGISGLNIVNRAAPHAHRADQEQPSRQHMGKNWFIGKRGERNRCPSKSRFTLKLRLESGLRAAA